jgi:peroxiredoxin
MMKPAIRNTLLLLIGIVAIFVILTFMTYSEKTMPDISFTDIDGASHQLSDYNGQPILVIFWATDCPGCIMEMPELIALHQEYADKGLAMIGVAMPHDRPEHIQAMRQQKQLPYLITWDQTGAVTEAFDNVRVTPTHFLISPQGEIVMRKIGTLKTEQLKQRLAMMGLEPGKS